MTPRLTSITDGILIESVASHRPSNAWPYANWITTHPGEVLKEEFLDPLGITQVAFARPIGVPLQAFGTTPQFWMNLQGAYELTSTRPDRTVERLAKSV